ncbi:MAG: cytochrome C biosynthesis protein [Sphingobium sp.]|nr:cytochrome C biosynthesis protein [Sphingobium sp.]
MTGILIAATMALAALLALKFGARLPWRHMAPAAAAIMLGLAGYAWQGRPNLVGHDVKPAVAAKFDERLAEKRRAIGERLGPASQWLIMSDGLARAGDTENAANVITRGLKENPKDADLWVGLGNALLAHAGGRLTPASEHAYRQATILAPQAISPGYFYGLALAQSGQFEAAQRIWAQLALRLPERADMRMELVRNLMLLDRLIAERDAAQGPQGRGQ